MNAHPASIQDLLVHADFLRRVVRDLVADEATREDLVQEVWLQALRSPPREMRGIRGWLATTARNLLANRRRSHARRAAREEFAGAGDPAPDVAEILDRESVRESVLRAVLALDEPFRGTVLLRYYEGLAPREIATRLGIPDATVRTRLSRGLERLKGRLDSEHGDRRAWVALVLPLGRPDAADTFSTPISLAPIAGGLALVACGIAAWFVFVGEDFAPTSSSAAGLVAEALVPAPAIEAEKELAAPQGGRRTTAPLPPASASESAAGRRAYAVERGRGSIHGLVVDAFDEPVPGARVRVHLHSGGVTPGLVVDEDRDAVPDAVTDGTGRFRFPSVEEGPVRVETTFTDGGRVELGLVLGAGEDAGPVRLTQTAARTPRGERFHVLVVDASGAPLADAAIEAWAWDHDERDPARADRSAIEVADHARTDESGRATLRPELADGIVLATTSDGRAGWKGFRNPNDARRPLRIVVEPTGSLVGTIAGVAQADLRGARLSVFALSSLEPYFTVGGRRIDVDLRGASFEARGLAAGTYVLELTAPSGVTLDHPPATTSGRALENSVTHVTVVVEAGRAARIELGARRGAVVRGRVLAHGAPVSGARVRAVRPPRTANFAAGFVLHGVHVWRFDGGAEQAACAPVSHVVTHTDAEGRYELQSLVPGRWRIEVARDGLAFDRREDLDARADEPIELVHDLVPCGVLQVGLLDATCVGVYAPDADVPHVLAIVRDGCATFAGLAPGDWRIALVHTDAAEPPRFLASARVEVGRLTWVDLRRADSGGRTNVRGTVRANGEPVADAVVTLGQSSARTDHAGRFDLGLASSSRTRGWSELPFRVRVGSAEHEIGLADDADPRTTPIDVELKGRTLAIEVLDARGDPARARLEATWMPSTPALVGRRGATLTGASSDGRFTFAAIDAGSLVGSVAFEDGWRAAIECAVPSDGILVVRRPTGGTLTVRVQVGGRPVEGRNVHVRSTSGEDGAPRWNLSRATDARGLVEVEAPAGNIDAWLPGGVGVTAPRGSVRLAAAQAAEIVLELPD